MVFLVDNLLFFVIQVRPVLVCTKNQASYERRVEQQKKDLADQQRLSQF